MRDLCFEVMNVKRELQAENERQLEKWGVQDHTPFEWLAYTLEELGELSEAISEWEYRGGLVEDIVKEAIQTATLAMKIAEMFRHTLVREEL